MKSARAKTMIGAGLTAVLLIGCAPQQSPEPPVSTDAELASMLDRVLTQEEQAQLTPDEVLTRLVEGNKRFVSGALTSRDLPAQVRAAAAGQYPEAVVLSCIDSRVPVESVFDRGIGDLFVARVAGNFENTDILGSLEFSTRVAGAKVVLVLGHEYCGAVKGAVDDVELGNITAMLGNIQPAVDHYSAYEGERSSANSEFLQMVVEQNVRQTVDDIRARSSVLEEMERNGEIKIVGGLYDMETGRVAFLD